MKSRLNKEKFMLSGWEKVNINEPVYRYNGFLIRYSIEIVENQAVDIMRADKEINHTGEKKKINFKTIGESYEEAKGEICNKINVYNGAISTKFSCKLNRTHF